MAAQPPLPTQPVGAAHGGARIADQPPILSLSELHKRRLEISFFMKFHPHEIPISTHFATPKRRRNRPKITPRHSPKIAPKDPLKAALKPGFKRDQGVKFSYFMKYEKNA